MYPWDFSGRGDSRSYTTWHLTGFAFANTLLNLPQASLRQCPSCNHAVFTRTDSLRRAIVSSTVVLFCSTALYARARTAQISGCLSTTSGTAWSQCDPFTCWRCLLQQQLLCRSHQLPIDVISAVAAALSRSAVWPRCGYIATLLRRRLPPPPPHSGAEHPSAASGGTRLAHCRSSR